MINTIMNNKILNGKLFTKGVGIFGALGNGQLSDCKIFQEIKYDNMKKVHSLSAGWGHSAVITEDNELLIFGRPFDFQSLMRLNSLYNVYKPMGRFVSNLTPKFGNDISGVFNIPSLVTLPDKVKLCKISAGLTGVLTDKGDVYMFGQNRWGQCAINNKESVDVFIPTKVNLPSPVLHFDVGLQHCIALCDTGHIYCWGKGSKGQLGTGDFESTFIPTLLTTKEIFSANIISIAAGFNHSVALCKSGVIYVFGKGMSNELKPNKSRLGK